MPKITGIVTAHGEAATSAVVELHNSNGDVVDQVQVDAEGRYTYHLTQGKWILNAWDAHGHRGRNEVSLGADDMEVEVQLTEHEH